MPWFLGLLFYIGVMVLIGRPPVYRAPINALQLPPPWIEGEYTVVDERPITEWGANIYTHANTEVEPG